MALVVGAAAGLVVPHSRERQGTVSEQRGLTWSGKWHIVNPGHPDARRYNVARCGTYVYRDDDPHYPEHLTRIKEGKKKSTGDCKSCTRSAGIKTVTVELPAASTQKPATDDENGFRSWDYPHGSVTVFDGGTIEWGSFHHDHPWKLRAAAAALLAAADDSERA